MNDQGAGVEQMWAAAVRMGSRKRQNKVPVTEVGRQHVLRDNT